MGFSLKVLKTRVACYTVMEELLLATFNRTFMYWGTSAESQPFAVPYPSIENTAFEAEQFVDSLRNANGELVTTAIGRRQNKQNLYWTVLPTDLWYEINQFILDNGMFFWCRYYDFNVGVWRTRQFYAGPSTADPYMVNAATHKPKWMLNCQLNVIDRGFINE